LRASGRVRSSPASIRSSRQGTQLACEHQAGRAARLRSIRQGAQLACEASGRQGAQLASERQASRSRSSLASIRQAGRAASSRASGRQGAQLARERQAAARKATNIFHSSKLHSLCAPLSVCMAGDDEAFQDARILRLLRRASEPEPASCGGKEPLLTRCSTSERRT
jgi:hypothetical protein